MEESGASASSPASGPVSSSRSWINGIGDMNQELVTFAERFIDIFALPANPRFLTNNQPNDIRDQHELVTESQDLMCAYNILYPEYDIDRRTEHADEEPIHIPECQQFRSNAKKIIKFIYKTYYDTRDNFINLEVEHDNFRDRIYQSTLNYLNSNSKLLQQNRVIELGILHINIGARFNLIRSLLTEEQFNQIATKLNIISEKLGTLPIIYGLDMYMHFYFIDVFCNDIQVKNLALEMLKQYKTVTETLLERVTEEIQRLNNAYRRRVQTIHMYHLLKIRNQLKDRLETYIEKLNNEINDLHARLDFEDQSAMSSIKDISTHTSKSTTFSESKYNSAEIIQDCRAAFHGIVNEPFKKHAKGFKKACHRLTAPSECRNIVAIRKTIYDFYTRRNMKLNDADAYPMEIDSNNILKSIFHHWSEYNDEFEGQKTFFERNMGFDYGYEMIQTGMEGIGEGLTRETFTAVARALKEERVFIPISETNNRYIMNYDFKFKIQGHDNTTNFWRFVGEFLGFCIINNISLDFRLSHGLLHTLLVKHGNNDYDKLITYFLIDNHGPEVNFMLNCLRDPNSIHTIYTDQEARFNDTYNIIIRRKNTIIQTRNFIKYILLRAYYQLNNGPMDPEGLNKPDTILYSDKLSEFVEGFQNLEFNKFKNILNKNKVNVQTLDRLLSDTNITLENLSLLADNLLCNTADTPHRQQLLEAFKKILKNGVRRYPMDMAGQLKYENKGSAELSKESTGKKMTRQQAYLLFAHKLLRFWCGNDQINFDPTNENPYRITFLNRPNSLPSSHTCFYTIDIPDDYRNFTHLYERINLAVFNTEAGLGNI